MSLSAFFSQTKTQIRSAILSHPIEIFMITAFAIGIWFTDMSIDAKENHMAYWLFEAMLFAFVYISRPYAWYRFSWVVPLATVIFIWLVNDDVDFYVTSPKFWGAQIIGLFVLCGFPFVKNNQAFTYRNFNNLFYIALAVVAWGLVFGLVAAILESISALFNIDFSREFQRHLYTSLGVFFPPLFFLVFQQRQAKSEMTLNRIFEILVNFVLAPALMIFTILFYAYVVKIALVGALPKGMVANIALPYLIAGFGIYALRSICVNARWEAFFKFYPYLSVVPIILLWLAIERRVSAYAWTEQRIYLVALAIAISVSCIILMLPKIRQYRLISGIVMVAVFTMTWVVNPKEIALESQTTRFHQLINKLGLSDGRGKIRDDVNLVERLETMKPDERNDWVELDDVTRYIVFKSMPGSYEYEKFDDHMLHLGQQYGDKIKELNTLSIYNDRFYINGEEISSKDNQYRKQFTTQNLQSIDIDGYKKLIYIPILGIYRKNDRNIQIELSESSSVPKKEPVEQLKVCFVETDDKYCVILDEHIQNVFKQHNIDFMKPQSDSVMQTLSNDLMKIKGQDFVIYLKNFDIQFDDEKGYIYQYVSGDFILEK